MPNCCNDAGILDCALHRYPTHIRSPNYCHHICMCQEIGIQKSLKLTFIHPGSRFNCLYAVNLCQTASMTLVFWNMIYTGTPHTFGLPTTAITCLFVKQQTPKKRSNTRLYTGWRFDCFYALILCQTASITEVFWSMLYTGTPHIFGLGTTTNTCVFVKEQTPKKRSNTRLYTRAGDSTAFMLSTCAKLLR